MRTQVHSRLTFSGGRRERLALSENAAWAEAAALVAPVAIALAAILRGPAQTVTLERTLQTLRHPALAGQSAQ